MIGIIDYGLGNLASILNMLRRIGVPAIISSDPSVLSAAAGLILPGVGAFDSGVSNLHASGLWSFLHEDVLQNGKPILGICLGVQLLTEGSDEGTLPGLGWIPGRTVAFDRSRLRPEHKIPNMGWRNITATRTDTLTGNLPPEPRFYFVHSFHLQCDDAQDVMITSQHGYEFTVGVRRKNVAGVQFHPEKSHKYGMALLRNFAGDVVECKP